MTPGQHAGSRRQTAPLSARGDGDPAGRAIHRGHGRSGREDRRQYEEVGVGPCDGRSADWGNGAALRIRSRDAQSSAFPDDPRASGSCSLVEGRFGARRLAKGTDEIYGDGPVCAKLGSIRLSGQNRDEALGFRRRLEALGDGAKFLVGLSIAEPRAESFQRS